jgi:hypothetical protein
MPRYPHWIESQNVSPPPRAHQNSYWQLLELRCVIILEKRRVYQSNNDGHKICGNCHAKLSFDQKPVYACISPHSLVHKNSVEYGTNCGSCKGQLVYIRPADECRGCIEEFRRADIARLHEGQGLRVDPTWVDTK